MCPGLGDGVAASGVGSNIEVKGVGSQILGWGCGSWGWGCGSKIMLWIHGWVVATVGVGLTAPGSVGLQLLGWVPIRVRSRGKEGAPGSHTS